MSDAIKDIVQARVYSKIEAEAAEAEDAERTRVRKFAEKWLEQWGLDAKLPPGQKGNPTECVLAHALGGSFNGEDWALPEDRLAYRLGYEQVDIPEDVRAFIRRFDNGEYPDLVEMVAESVCAE